MTIHTLTISSSDSEKGRSFSGSLLAYAEADHLWSGGDADTEKRRPVWIMIALSDAEAGPFAANLRLGKVAEVVGGSSGYSRRNKGDKYELLRSAGYSYTTQRHAEGVVLTAFLPELFRLDPGMVDPMGCKFVMLPAQDWCLDPQAKALSHVMGCGFSYPSEEYTSRNDNRGAFLADLPMLCRIAPLFAAYLDRRTRAPLIPDPRFYAQVLAAAVVAGYCQRGWAGKRYHEEGVERVGLLPGLAMSATHEELEALLSEQVRVFEAMGRKVAA